MGRRKRDRTRCRQRDRCDSPNPGRPGGGESPPDGRAGTQAIPGDGAAPPGRAGRNLLALESFSAAVISWIGDNPLRQGEIAAERNAFEALLAIARQGDPTQRARAWTEENLPAFIYYDDYGRLDTLIHLPSFLARQ